MAAFFAGVFHPAMVHLVIHIRRMQERDGSITDMTKTVAGTRDIPMCSLLRAMLME